VQEVRPIPASLLVSLCVSVPIPLDRPHSVSTLKKIKRDRIHNKGRKTKERERTDEIFLTSVKFLSTSIEPKLLFAAHLEYKGARGTDDEKRHSITRRGRFEPE